MQGLQEGLALLLQRAAHAGRRLGAGGLGGAAERLRLVQQIAQLAQPQLRMRAGSAPRCSEAQQLLDVSCGRRWAVSRSARGIYAAELWHTE